MATRTRGTHGATAEGTSAEGAELPSLSPEERTGELASRGSAVAAAVLIISSLLPWVSVTFFSAATLTGVRLWEGRVVLILGIAAGACALGALYWEELNRRSLLLAAAVCSIVAFIVTVVFGFRFREALSIPSILGETQALTLARAGSGLESGWYLALASSVVLAALALWGYFGGRGGRPAQSVPNMEWVEPGTSQGARQPGTPPGSQG